MAKKTKKGKVQKKQIKKTKEKSEQKILKEIKKLPVEPRFEKKTKNKFGKTIISFLLNLVFPGIGTLIIKRIKEGIIQLILLTSGLIFLIPMVSLTYNTLHSFVMVIGWLFIFSSWISAIIISIKEIISF